MNHFLHIADLSPKALHALLKRALTLKQEVKRGKFRATLKNKTLGLVFEKPSLRTRISFEVGMRQLGGQALYISPAEIGLGKRESVADVARVLSRYVDGIMARTFEHQTILELAHWATVPVINGLSDYNHPCQALADVLTVLEWKGKFKGLRAAFIGDGFNVATSFAHAATKLGMQVTVASPKGYELPARVVTLAEEFASASGGSITLTHDPQAAAKNADVIYTDTWTSMGQEAETAKRRADFAGFQVNDDLLKLARKNVMVLHCLPAHRGEEITDAVMDGKHSAVFDQAENRLHTQKAVLLELLG